MSLTENGLIKRAAQNLELEDILLYESSFERPFFDFPDDAKICLQYKRSVEYNVLKESESTDLNPMLQVFVALGVRAVGEDNEGIEREAICIEAEYLALYQVIGDIPENALESFVEFNSVHNVWSFWRQHVFDIVARSGLPKIEIPLFSGVDM